MGINAAGAGFTAGQAAMASFLCMASAGEYALFSLAAASATYFEVALMELVVNARYLLMSCALSQKLSPDIKTAGRLHIGL
ncbi:MAG: AzlC family ABC transporter permease [Lachnospiraceae bacterium]|nr:AzlC family ABC transporter permease [Lachnospiraceae bacterium]